MTSPITNTAGAAPWCMDMAAEVPLQFSVVKAAKLPTHTVSKLFVGSLSAAESRQFIEENSITHILTVAASLPVNIPKDCNVQHKIVECHDHPMASILEVIPSSLSFIYDAFESNGNVLVHCASGVSRSVAVCASFLIDRYEDMDLKSALESIASVRNYANPNLGFRRQLQVLENCNGDVDTAKKLYSEHTSNVVEDAIRQRNAVNELHARVDDVEVSIASIMSKHTDNEESEEGNTRSAQLKSFKNELTKLQVELDSCLPEEDFFVDPPAKMVRKAASAKIQRLLVSIQYTYQSV